MPKISSILIVGLVLTNAITGVVFWRSQKRIQYLAKEASVFATESTKALQEVHSLKKIARTTNFAPMPNCMKDIDAKDLTYFSATAQQVSIVYRCDDKQTAASLRFYRWPLTEKPNPNNSIPFGKIQQPGLKLAITQTFGKRSTETR